MFFISGDKVPHVSLISKPFWKPTNAHSGFGIA